METKICTQCWQEKPIDDFSKSYKNLCKYCVAENERNKRAKKSHYEDGYVSLKGHAMHGMITASPDAPQFIPHPRFIASVAAMQGLLNATSVERFTLRIKPEEIAKCAVEYADALINELNKPKDKEDEVEEHQ